MNKNRSYYLRNKKKCQEYNKKYFKSYYIENKDRITKQHESYNIKHNKFIKEYNRMRRKGLKLTLIEFYAREEERIKPEEEETIKQKTEQEETIKQETEEEETIKINYDIIVYFD
mgnify:CR=1 FL=1